MILSIVVYKKKQFSRFFLKQEVRKSLFGLSHSHCFLWSWLSKAPEEGHGRPFDWSHGTSLLLPVEVAALQNRSFCAPIIRILRSHRAKRSCKWRDSNWRLWLYWLSALYPSVKDQRNLQAKGYAGNKNLSAEKGLIKTNLVFHSGSTACDPRRSLSLSSSWKTKPESLTGLCHWNCQTSWSLHWPKGANIKGADCWSKWERTLLTEVVW